MAQTERKRSAGDKERLVGGMTILAVTHTVLEGTARFVVEGTGRLVVEGTVRLVAGGIAHPVAEDKVTPAVVGMVAARSQAEEPRTQIHPGMVKIAWAY
jgi:hypothetical protein